MERSVGLSPEVLAVIRHLPPELKREIRAAIERLRRNPELGKSLKGELEGWQSLRVRRLRIVYRATARAIDVAAIGPRVSIYLETARLERVRRR